jgi:hypothetical protein
VLAEAAATPAGGATVKGTDLSAWPDVTAATPAGTANPVRLAHVAAATVIRAARRQDRRITM